MIYIICIIVIIITMGISSGNGLRRHNSEPQLALTTLGYTIAG